MKWQKNVSRLHTFIKHVSPTRLGFSFTRPAWVRFNHLQTNVGLFHLKIHKWVMASMVACDYGAKDQTAEHVITSCPIYHHPNRARALSDVNKNLATWLMEIGLAI